MAAVAAAVANAATAANAAAAATTGVEAAKAQMAVKAEGFAAKAKGLVVKALLGRDLIFALVFFAVASTLTGIVLGLSRVMDPALAAGATGVVLLAALAGAALWIGKAPKPERDTRED